MKNKFLQYIGELVLAVLVLGIVFTFLRLGLLTSVANSFDFTVFFWQPEESSDEIVLVTLDEKTINQPRVGYPCISRHDYVAVLENILKNNPKVVGVDVFFYNPSKDEAEDEALSNLFKEHRNLITGIEYDFNNNYFLLPTSTLDIPPDQLGYVSLASGLNTDNTYVKQVPILIDPENSNSVEYEPFVFKVFRALKIGRQSSEIDSEKGNYKIIRNGEELSVPLQNNAANINFYGPRGSYKQISFFDVLTNDFKRSDFSNKIVLLGATAHDIHDEFLTPVSVLSSKENTDSPSIPGVEIHANFLQTLLKEDFINYQSTDEKFIWSFGLIVFLLLAFIFASFWTSTVITILGFIFIYALSVVYFRSYGVVVSYFWPIFAGVVFWASVNVWRFLMAERGQRQIKDTFSKYVSTDVVNEILASPEKINLGGESKKITIMFSDIESFTSLAETLPTKKVLEFINLYLKFTSKSILEAKGTIDKFIGDAVMSFWGAPLPMQDQAIKACGVALKQKNDLPNLNQELKRRGLPQINFRIGINTGDSVVGNVGTDERMNYTALGDAVNLASRLEGVNKEYGTQVILSEYTYTEIKDKFICRELDLIKVKGKNHPVKIYELIAEKGKETKEQKELISNYEKALKLYREQKWTEAEKAFAELKDHASEIMLLRIKKLKDSSLPSNWDGAYTFYKK